MYETVIDSPRRAYDRSAADRDAGELQPWKAVECEGFADLLHSEGGRRLLEIGAGPGHFGAYFRDNGLDVTCTDLSPEMARLCRDKGLNAYVMDFLHLDFPPGSFDAVFALNCLLHVPSADLPRVLSAIHQLLRLNGLFFYGVYGGYAFEGVWPDDRHDPQRFFVFYTDDELRRRVSDLFDVVSFRRIAIEAEDRGHFQSLILRPRELP